MSIHIDSPVVTNCHPERNEGSASIGSGDTLRASFAASVRVLLAMLREVFDESAYARFLSRNQLVSSRAAYAEFLREHASMKERRPRCC